MDIEQIEILEKSFRWIINEDATATKKTAEGIRNSDAEMKKLGTMI
tara:strand:- start:2129 stop:2266 length:138 start_codon:yes stop_codon:yes gene_type:complete